MRAASVLHVDDDIDDAFFLKEALKGIEQQIRVRVQNVANGAEALDYLMGVGPYSDRNRYPIPDLILLDINMPVVNGFEFLEWLRGKERFRAMPVYMLSSSNDPWDMTRARELGAAGYVVKQVGFREAASVVTSVLQASRPDDLRACFQS
jgi:CheY-like chemotaxis protein